MTGNTEPSGLKRVCAFCLLFCLLLTSTCVALSTLKVSGVGQVGEEHPPPYVSQAKSITNAVKSIKVRMRTLKLCLERRIGKRIPPRHPIMSWRAPHPAAILRYRSRGDDGKTPYERIRRRPFNSRLVVVVTNSGPKSPPTKNTDGIRAYF